MLRKCDLIWLAGVISSILISQFGCLEPLKKIWKGSLPVSLALAFALGLSGWVFAGNTAGIIQSGYDNEAYIEQYYGYYDWNKASQTQVGTSNYVYTHQEGNNNEAFVKQDGNNNRSDCSACDGRDFTVEVGDKAYTITSPIFNTFPYTQYQNGKGNKAYIDVLGDENNSCQWQEGDGNYADIDIYGSGNSNTAKQVQLNGGNTATISKNGSFNTVCQYQGGSREAHITIYGDGKSVCVVQNW